MAQWHIGQSEPVLILTSPSTPYTYHTFHGFLTALSTEMSRWASQLRGRIGTVVTFQTSRRIRLSRAHQGICVLVEYWRCFRRKAALFKSSTGLSVGGLLVEKYHTVIPFHIRTGFCASMRLDLPNQLVKFNKNYKQTLFYTVRLFRATCLHILLHRVKCLICNLQNLNRFLLFATP